MRGFSLNVRGRDKLNFDVLKRNDIEKVTTPLDEACKILAFNPYKVTGDPKTKQLMTLTEIIRYQLLCDKSLLDSQSFFSYP